jgi:hypothetical protein
VTEPMTAICAKETAVDPDLASSCRRFGVKMSATALVISRNPFANGRRPAPCSGEAGVGFCDPAGRNSRRCPVPPRRRCHGRRTPRPTMADPRYSVPSPLARRTRLRVWRVRIECEIWGKGNEFKTPASTGGLSHLYCWRKSGSPSRTRTALRSRLKTLTFSPD